MSHKRPLVHIGYHKTGTTWLQRRVFNAADAGFVTPWTSTVISEALVLPNELDFNADTARESFTPVFHSSLEAGLVPVVSWERLSGSPHAGGFDSAALARRLHTVFSDARVLVVVREQRSMIYALYQQYVRNGGIASLEGYLRPRHTAEVPQFCLKHLEYDRLVRLYRELFGKKRVLVLAFEELRADPRGFAARVAAYAGAGGSIHSSALAAENTSFKPATVALKRHANRWFVRNALSPGARYYVKNHEERFARLDGVLPAWLGKRRARGWRVKIERLVGHRYRPSNSRLQQMVETDLSDVGYEIASSDGRAT